MREEAIQFGPGGRLAGVLTTPASGAPRECVGLVNSGLMPRSGPYRVYTQLARRLAEQGVASFRFDLGGLGDSAAGISGRLRDRTRHEIGAAVGVLTERFPDAALALGGICSGAEDSFRYAESDARVSRLIMIDPFDHRTLAWRLRIGIGQSLRTLGLRGKREAGEDTELIEYQYMAFEESSRILRQQAERGSRIHFVYSSVRRHPPALHGVVTNADARRRITMDVLPMIGHMQLLQGERDLLIGTILRRLTEGPHTSAPRATE